MNENANAAPGWYNPDGKPGSLRYWDGKQWTDQTGRTKTDRNMAAVNAVLVVLLILGIMVAASYMAGLPWDF